MEANLARAILVPAWTQLWIIALVATTISFRTAALHVVADDVVACSTLFEVMDSQASQNDRCQLTNACKEHAL
eukprot:COSAG02_NODE_86_length_39084_cov_17.815724_41_plen_73_part_00